MEIEQASVAIQRETYACSNQKLVHLADNGPDVSSSDVLWP